MTCAPYQCDGYTVFWSGALSSCSELSYTVSPGDNCDFPIADNNNYYRCCCAQ